MAIKHRFDFTQVLSRASTWLALLALGAGGALGAYALLPDQGKELFPEWALQALSVIAVGAGFLIPIATSFKQKGLGRATQVVVTKETTVTGDVTPEDATRIAETVQTPPAA